MTVSYGRILSAALESNLEPSILKYKLRIKK